MREILLKELLIPTIGLLVSVTCMGQGTVLKQAYGNQFLMGAAIAIKDIDDRGDVLQEIVLPHYNTITSENCFKWERIHPKPGKFEFGRADRFVNFGQANGLHMVGHVLVWHQQTPRWVYNRFGFGSVGKERLSHLMVDHIQKVVGHYRGRIHAWDVVNEAVEDDGSLRDSFWREILGDDYLELAYRTAHQADPGAELYYNDYNMTVPRKVKGVIRMLEKLLDKGVPVHGVGMQGHWSLEYPSVENLRNAIEAYGKLGLKVMITELDVSVLPSAYEYQGAEISAIADYSDELDPYTGGLPEEVAELQAKRYKELFEVLLDYPEVISRVTFWGITDGDSWKNNFPVRGRTDYPLLFDRNNQPKPAFWAVIEATGNN